MSTDENLMSRGCSMASKCSLCNINAESYEHLFLACPFSIIIWQWMSGIFGIPLNLTSIENMLKACNLH
ncbi:putative reverse transcriptase zinc-binding domain-containing protein [Lupinus albus]|uniref:Putative reverse transcriptase zinc-binding domain-containing protein n=1 Tax=Lupinus albus TaxID=3870 RepID=A0A6A4QVP2_LUPAL|nr:putative reverse transcriptase zinc-binding domain-containing protein [Lupinus albus]